MSKFNRMGAKKELYTRGFNPSDLKDKTDEDLDKMLVEQAYPVNQGCSTMANVPSTEKVEKIEENLDSVLDNLEVETEVVNNALNDLEIEKVPDYLSPEWSDYVLKQFSKDELNDGAPNLPGLRRVAQLLLGTIISSQPVVLNASLDSNSYGRASCVYEVVFEWHDGNIRKFGGIASSYPGNTDKNYAKYCEAMAETRSEARALRKALLLHNPASEEICITPTTEDISINTIMSNKISPTQTSMIKNRCNEYKIDINKFIKKIIGEEILFENLSREQAQTICSTINEIQTSRRDIEEDIKAL